MRKRWGQGRVAHLPTRVGPMPRPHGTHLLALGAD